MSGLGAPDPVRVRSSAPVRIGRYALLDEIAAGGMATVHFARLRGDGGFARTVAIKRLHAQYAKDPDFSKMFLDEARIAARVRHPNVIGIVDVASADGELFLVMEYVHGESLSRLVRRAREDGQAIPTDVAAAIVCGALHGLHAAHEAKDEDGAPLHIVHRDVSPQNVLVGVDGVARVLDFGVAKAVGRMSATEDGKVKGKLAYMSPEQLRAEPVDRRSDIYAAGVVLWEMLTGASLFAGEGDASTLARALERKVAPPSTLAPSLPPTADAVTMRALQASPAKRFVTAKEMADALESALGVASPSRVAEWVDEMGGGDLTRRGQALAEIERSSDDAVPSVAVPVSVPDAAPPPPRRRGALVASLGIVVAAGLLVSYASYARVRATETHAAPAASPSPPIALAPTEAAALSPSSTGAPAPSSSASAATLAPVAPAQGSAWKGKKPPRRAGPARSADPGAYQ